MLIPTWWSPQGPCRVNSFWLALGRLVSMRASSSFREQISIKTVLYRHFEKSFHKNTSICYKISLSHKNQSISRRKIVVPMEHIFITDTFISTLSKLDFFKEELPFSSRAKGAPNLFKSQYHRASYIQFSHESNGQREREELFNPRVELSFAFPRRRGHVPLVAHPGREVNGHAFCIISRIARIIVVAKLDCASRELA